MNKLHLPIIFILMVLISCNTGGGQKERGTPFEEGDILKISRDQYYDQLYGFWLGQNIANWTGLVTEMDKIGNIGEMIAAIATIGTLAYLAIQVRQNTRALRSSTFQDIANDMSVSSAAICTHPELPAVFARGSESHSDENLSFIGVKNGILSIALRTR
jgi:hypothetical protein